MITKTFEIRDRATFIPALAIKLEPTDERDRYLLARAGYGITPAGQAEYVVLMRLTDCTAEIYPWVWSGGRTMPEAHKHIILRFNDLANGAVIDVEFILGESKQPKQSEALE